VPLALLKKNDRQDLSTLFCSELVAQTLKSLGVVPESLNSSNITPKDFDELTYEEKLHFRHYGEGDFVLEKGSTFLEPFRIIFDPAKHADTNVAIDVLQTNPLPPKHE